MPNVERHLSAGKSPCRRILPAWQPAGFEYRAPTGFGHQQFQPTMATCESDKERQQTTIRTPSFAKGLNCPTSPFVIDEHAMFVLGPIRSFLSCKQGAPRAHNFSSLIEFDDWWRWDAALDPCAPVRPDLVAFDAGQALQHPHVVVPGRI